MIEKINDWAPETRSLLRALIAAGCTLLAGNNGEDEFEFETEDQFIEGLTACDEARLYVLTPDGGGRKWIYLVYGNEPGVLMSDYVVDPVLDAVSDAHYAEWSGRAQPMKEVNR